jgi:PAS domain S-box-containing protein
VDDEVDSLHLLQRTLQKDFHVYTAQSGCGAIEMLHQCEFAVLIVDERMPGMTGLEVLEQSRVIQPMAVRILLTAYADVETLANAINSDHIYYYIAKPWDPDELSLLVRQASEHYRLTQENHRLLAELSLAKQQWEAAFASLPDGVVLFDAERRVLRANAAATRLTGITADKLIGKTCCELAYPVAHNPADCVISHAIGQGRLFEEEITDLGKKRFYQMTACPMIDSSTAGDHLRGIVLVVRDLTERHELHEQLARSERARALGTMAGGVAHNFNNMLTAILGHTQLLQKRAADPHVVQGLKMIEKASQDAANMVYRLLEFTKSERDLRLHPVDCNQIVRDAIELTRPRWEHASQATGHPIQIHTRLGSDASVLGNAGELREALVNFILNAVEAMPHGGQLTITTWHENDEVLLQLQDTGVGMDEFTQQHAFDPFFSTKGSVGVGLGLTQSYNIVERHGGNLRLTSAPGTGTCLTVTLPAATEMQEVAPDVVDAPAARTGRVLVVDDEETVRDIMVAMLNAMGHTAVACQDGPTALAVLERETFDLACIDFSMPGMGGVELVKIIKHRWPWMQVVVITGWMDSVISQRGPVPIDGFIQKPFEYEELARTIANALHNRRASATS